MSLALLAGGAFLMDSPRAWAADVASSRELLLVCDTDNLAALSGEVYNVAAMTPPGLVKILDVASARSFKIDTPFFGHTLTQNPDRPHQIATFEKWGRKGALVDLKEKALVAHFETSGDNIFFGHAAYIPGASVLVTSEDNERRTDGQLVVRDSSNMKTIRKFSSYGVKPHESRLVDHGRTLMVLNQGWGDYLTNLAWVDMNSGKLLHKIMLNVTPASTFAHMDISHDGWIAVVGYILPGQQAASSLFGLIAPDGRVIRLQAPVDMAADLRNEVVGVTFLGKSGLVAVAASHADHVLVWKYKTQEFVASVQTPSPKGIIPDLAALDSKPAVIVSSYKARDLTELIFSPQDKAPAIAKTDPSFGGCGSHLVRVYA